MFSIPWKHAARHGWEIEKDASLFKMWAIHTGEQLINLLCKKKNTLREKSRRTWISWQNMSAGKHVEGGNCDAKTWKANFRCAMNSLPDIQEMKKMSVNKGHQAVRVFKMLPVETKCKGEEVSRLLNSACGLEEMFLIFNQSPHLLLPMQESEERPRRCGVGGR